MSGVSGAPALSPVEFVASSEARRPAQGKCCSTHHPLENPVRTSPRSKSAWSRGGNVQVRKRYQCPVLLCLVLIWAKRVDPKNDQNGYTLYNTLAVVIAADPSCSLPTWNLWHMAPFQLSMNSRPCCFSLYNQSYSRSSVQDYDCLLRGQSLWLEWGQWREHT